LLRLGPRGSGTAVVPAPRAAPRGDERLDLQVRLEVVHGPIGRGATELLEARPHALAKSRDDGLLQQLVDRVPHHVPGTRLEHLRRLQIEEVRPLRATVLAVAVGTVVTVVVAVVVVMVPMTVVVIVIVALPMTRTPAPVAVAHRSSLPPRRG
jgi:hypothetical protein